MFFTIAVIDFLKHYLNKRKIVGVDRTINLKG